MDLSRKTALVTGAGRGIGRATALQLGAAGARVILTARGREEIEAAAAEIRSHDGKAEAIPADVGRTEDVRALFAAAGPVDILVNNAGVLEPAALIVDGDPALWARNIEINLVGAYNMIRAVLPAMIAAGAGRIVNLSSGAASRPVEGWSAYCAAKAGLAMLTRAIALEAGPALRVFGLSPGATDTDMHVINRASGINRVSRIPREALRPVDVAARLVLYLCTPEADDLSGREVSATDPEFARRAGVA